MEQIILWGIALLISIFFAWVLYAIAGKRDANQNFWAIMGFLFGPLALPFVFFARKQKMPLPENEA